MKYLFKVFDKYLPKGNYDNEPIMFLSNESEVIYVYSFDRKKCVILTSDMFKEHFKYISLYEIYNDDWKIIHKNEIKKILFSNVNYDELPF